MGEAGTHAGRRRGPLPGVLAALGPPLVFAALAWPALTESSATYDETEHVPAGYVSLARADHRLGPEHPPLVKQLFALPLLPLAPRISPDAERALAVAARDIDAHWIFGDRFLYKDNDPHPLLFRARLVVLALGVLLVLLVHRWAREAFGPAGGFLAATLAALDPNLLAHATLATTDAGFALLFLAALYLARRAFTALTPLAMLAAGVVAGAALAAKHSALLLPPLLLALGAARAADARPWPLGGSARTVARTVAARAAAGIALLVLWGLLAWGTLWAVYGFRYAAGAGGAAALPTTAQWVERIPEMRALGEILAAGGSVPDDATLRARAAARPLGLAERVIPFAERHRLLPEGYVFGLAFATAMAQVRRSYLLGEISLVGRPWYFPFALLVKTPVATLALLALALGLLAAARRPAAAGAGCAGESTRGIWREALPLLLPAAAVVGAAMGSNLNIGYRHVLPALPFLWILAGHLPDTLARLAGRRAAAVALGAACALLLAETAAARPYYLPFFNALAGGPRGGIRLLSDSNLDWGQALPALKRWMDERGVTRINLCYFGTADPAAYGIEAVPLAGTYVIDVPGAGRAGYLPQAPELPGWVAVSATHLQGTYLFPERLREYYAFLRHKEPVAVPGHAIYVYRVERWGE